MSLESFQFERDTVISAAGFVVRAAGGTDPVVEARPEQALAAVAPAPVRFCFVVRRVVNQRPIVGRVRLVLAADGTDRFRGCPRKRSPGTWCTIASCSVHTGTVTGHYGSSDSYRYPRHARRPPGRDSSWCRQPTYPDTSCSSESCSSSREASACRSSETDRRAAMPDSPRH